MRILFIYSPKKRDEDLLKAFKTGCEKHGDKVLPVLAKRYKGERADVICAFGLKGNSKKTLHRCWKTGVTTLYFDKPYTRYVRGHSFYRVSINSFHPLQYFQQNRPNDRWEKLRIELKPKQKGKHVIFAGSSEKYHEWYGIGGSTEYAQKQIDTIRRYSSRPIIYRPKPSWKDAIPIDGTYFSRPPELIGDVLSGAHVLVAYGSNAGTDAIFHGVPAIVLGDGIAKPVAETSISNIENPYFPSDKERYQWCCDLAYCQWSLTEFASGEAWDDLRRQL